MRDEPGKNPSRSNKRISQLPVALQDHGASAFRARRLATLVVPLPFIIPDSPFDGAETVLVLRAVNPVFWRKAAIAGGTLESFGASTEPIRLYSAIVRQPGKFRLGPRPAGRRSPVESGDRFVVTNAAPGATTFHQLAKQSSLFELRGAQSGPIPLPTNLDSIKKDAMTIKNRTRPSPDSDDASPASSKTAATSPGRREFLRNAAMMGGLAALAPVVPFLDAGEEHPEGRLVDYPFFPFCIDWSDSKKRSFKQQAEMLKELGYEGMGHIGLDRVEERLKTLDEAGLRLFQITMVVDVAPGKEAYEPRFKDVLPVLKGRKVQFCLIINGAKPSDAAADPRGVEILREMAELALDSGSQLLLYPHTGCWVERIEDSVRVASKVDRANVGAMFNLCHWLRVDKQRDYRSLLKQALPRLWAVSLNGADEFDEKPGWDRYIQPLDKGSFDVGKFLKALREIGYKGPIGLQCYGIGGDAREHLARSMTAWRGLGKNLGR
jgi:sugar phosphate isomerase/epimerase